MFSSPLPLRMGQQGEVLEEKYFNDSVEWTDSEIFLKRWFGLRYQFEVAEYQFFLWHGLTGWSVMSLVCLICLLIPVSTFAAVAREKNVMTHAVMSSALFVLAIFVASTEFWFKGNRNAEKMRKLARCREVSCIVFFCMFCCYGAMLFYPDQTEEEGLVPFLLSPQFACFMIEKPRAIFVIPTIILSTVLAFSLRPLNPHDTAQHMLFAMAIVFTSNIMSIVFKLILECEQRRRFEVFAVLLSITQDVKNAARLHKEFVDSLVPPALRSRLVGGKAIVDLALEASCVLIGIHNFAILPNVMLPLEIGIVTSTLHYMIETVTDTDVHKMGIIGDVVCFAVNLLTPVRHHEYVAARFALRVSSQFKTWENLVKQVSLQSVVHSGSLLGAVSSRGLIYYDLFGTAFTAARPMLDACPVNSVLASSDILQAVGSSATSRCESNGFYVLENLAGGEESVTTPRTIHAPAGQRFNRSESSFAWLQENEQLGDEIRIISYFCFTRHFCNEEHEREFWKMIHGKYYFQGFSFCALCAVIFWLEIVALWTIEMHGVIDISAEVGLGCAVVTFLLFLCALFVPLCRWFDKTNRFHVVCVILLWNVAPFGTFFALPLLRPAFIAKDVTYVLTLWCSTYIATAFLAYGTTVIASAILVVQIGTGLGCSYIEGSSDSIRVAIVICFAFGAIVVKEIQQRRAREAFRQNLLIERAKIAAENQKQVRETLLKTILPAPVLGIVAMQRGTGAIMGKNYGDTAVLHLRFDGLARAALSGDLTKLTEEIDATKGLVAAELVDAALWIVRVFGDLMLIAGPLCEGNDENEQLCSLFAGLRCIQSLSMKPSFGMFSAVLIYETAVAVITHTEYPTFQLFGTAPARAQGIMNAAPEGSLLATEVVARMVASFTERLDEDFGSLPDDEGWPFDGVSMWRIRGLGAVGVHNIRRQLVFLPV